MFNVGDTVTIKVRNALYDVRHRYANGYVGPEFNVYTGTIVREIALLGGDVSKFVFPSVEQWLHKKMAANQS